MIAHILWPKWFWDPNGTWAGFWGGFGGDLNYFAAFVVAYFKFRCHVTGCRRLGLHPVNGTTYHVCRRHHPDDALTVEQVHQAYNDGP